MIGILCHTNLDLDNRERWPSELLEVPRVGDEIESSFLWEPGSGYASRLRLKVVSVTWRYGTDWAKGNTPKWYPEVELHLPNPPFGTIKEFYEWYGRITGRGVHAFI